MTFQEIPFDKVLNRFKSTDPEEKELREKFTKFLKFITLRVRDHYEIPPVVVSINGVPIATQGNFSASVGKPKSKKTFNVCALIAALLSEKQVLDYTANLPKGKLRILYVDTEQSRVHCHKVLHRIVQLSGISPEEADERIQFVMLREFSPRERRNIIDMALSVDHNIGFVVIDGIRDLISDINSPGESVDIINDLMRWTQVYDIHIHTVLHLNKSDDNTRGHIGTELNNKAETVLKVVRNGENPTISEVKPMITRDQEFDSFAFKINDQGLPELVADFDAGNNEKVSVESITVAQHKKALDAIFAQVKMLGYGELLNSLQREYASIGYERARTSFVYLLKVLTNVGVIEKVNKKYSYCPDNVGRIIS